MTEISVIGVYLSNYLNSSFRQNVEYFLTAFRLALYLRDIRKEQSRNRNILYLLIEENKKSITVATLTIIGK